MTFMSGGETLRLADVGMGIDPAALRIKVMGGNQRYRCAACGVHAYVVRGRLARAVCRNCGAERFEPLQKPQPEND